MHDCIALLQSHRLRLLLYWISIISLFEFVESMWFCFTKALTRDLMSFVMSVESECFVMELQ